MMRGGNRRMNRMMDKMGLDIEEMSDVREVIIRTNKKELVIENPSVSKMKNKDGTTFAVAGEYSERELEVQTFPDEDVEMICEQTGVDREKAIKALADEDGDLARAIMTLGG